MTPEPISPLQRLKRKNYAVLLVLVAFIALLYAISIVKLMGVN
jgi:hypothetical protein